MLPSASRSDAQPVVRAVALRFFDVHLRGDPTAQQHLETAALQHYRRGAITAIAVTRR
jgi:hypothetical protein